MTVDLRRLLAPHPGVVNVCGPVGIGKSHAVRGLGRVVDLSRAAHRSRLPAASDTPIVFDGVDHEAAASVVRRFVDASVGTRVIVAGRRPLASRPEWTDQVVSTVELPVWTSAAIRDLVRAGGVTESVPQDVVVRLAGGVPLLADCLCRALRGGAPADVPGGLADAAAREVLRRLATEAAEPAPGTLPVVAAVDGADEDLLAALVTLPPGLFDRLREISVTSAEAHGLTVREPYRSLFELAYRWRHPVAHRELATRAAHHRHRQLPSTVEAPTRARLADQILYLSPDPRVREIFFPHAAPAVRVRPAGPADGEAIARLIRAWATDEGLNARRSEKMLDLWWGAETPGFHLAVDADERPVGLMNLLPTGPSARPALEPLLQQYASSLVDDARGGVVLGMMTAGGHPAARAALLRHTLTSAVVHGRVVVSTSWPPYQELSLRLGLRHHGETRHDFYHCGRHSGIFSQTFTPDTLSQWLHRLHGPVRTPPNHVAVRDALAHLREPARLRRSPLLALPGLGTPEALKAFLHREIDALVTAPSEVDSVAGRILEQYYLKRGGGHDALAHRLHLSRATYFRRLDHGLKTLTTALRDLLPD